MYQWGPKYLVGFIAQSTSGDDKQLVMLPVVGENGKAVLLINRTDHTLQIGAASQLLPDVVSAQSIDRNGFKAQLKIGEMELPGYSLTLLAN